MPPGIRLNTSDTDSSPVWFRHWLERLQTGKNYLFDLFVGLDSFFTPLESPAASSGDEDLIPFRANTGFNAPLAPLETFSNGVNEPPRWKVEDFLTGFTLSDLLHEIGHFDG